jgi:hypothetical protein
VVAECRVLSPCSRNDGVPRIGERLLELLADLEHVPVEVLEAAATVEVAVAENERGERMILGRAMRSRAASHRVTSQPMRMIGPVT